MNSLQIGRRRFSELFWNIVDEKVENYPHTTITDVISTQQSLRVDADYNTGSLGYDDAIELYKLVRFFAPTVIAEVGTFIGVSTTVMSFAAPLKKIYTCDMSNHITLDIHRDVIQYPKQTSTQMFKDLAEKEVKVDLVYLDGRLSPDDFEPLNKIIHEKTVFVLDDFEGIEKGIANALMLEHPSRVLIYPRGDRKTAVSLPVGLIQLVPQEMT
jgi:predicted O-methyltransferase YrrM